MLTAVTRTQTQHSYFHPCSVMVQGQVWPPPPNNTTANICLLQKVPFFWGGMHEAWALSLVVILQIQISYRLVINISEVVQSYNHGIALCLSISLCDERTDKENDIIIFSHSSLLFVAMVTCSRLPSEDGSVISSESVKEVSGKGSIVQKATAQQKLTKEETRKSNGEKSTFTHLLSGHKQTAVLENLAMVP